MTVRAPAAPVWVYVERRSEMILSTFATFSSSHYAVTYAQQHLLPEFRSRHDRVVVQDTVTGTVSVITADGNRTPPP